jgi:hypothetical protein
MTRIFDAVVIRKQSLKKSVTKDDLSKAIDLLKSLLLKESGIEIIENEQKIMILQTKKEG